MSPLSASPPPPPPAPEPEPSPEPEECREASWLQMSGTPVMTDCRTTKSPSSPSPVQLTATLCSSDPFYPSNDGSGKVKTTRTWTPEDTRR